jgi:hypothetical protein
MQRGSEYGGTSSAASGGRNEYGGGSAASGGRNEYGGGSAASGGRNEYGGVSSGDNNERNKRAGGGTTERRDYDYGSRGKKSATGPMPSESIFKVLLNVICN